MFGFWRFLRRLAASVHPTRSRRRREAKRWHAVRPTRLELQCLEDRTMLSGTPLTLADQSALLAGLSQLSSVGTSLDGSTPLASDLALLDQSVAGTLSTGAAFGQLQS